MKRILSTILCLALVMTTLTEKSFAFSYIPTNTDDPSCIDVRQLDASNSYITYKGAKEVCGCKTCTADIMTYSGIVKFLDKEKPDIFSNSLDIRESITNGDKWGHAAEGVVRWIEVPAANLNKILANLGLYKLSFATSAIVGVSAAGTLVCLVKKQRFYKDASTKYQNLKIDESILRQLSVAIDNKEWQNNNFILVVSDSKQPSAIATFKNKPGLTYEGMTFGENYFNKINDEFKLLLIAMNPQAQTQLQAALDSLNVDFGKKVEYYNVQQAQIEYKELIDSGRNQWIKGNADTVINAATNLADSIISTVNASKVAKAKEKEKLEKTQNNTKEVSTQTQNDQAIQTETKDTQANTNANASTTENKLTDKMEKAIKDKVEQSVNKATTEKALQSNNAKVEKPAVNVDVKSTTAQKAELTNTAKNNTPKPNENKSSSVFKNPFNSDKENASKFEASININTSKKIDDRRINIKAKPGANVTFNQFICNQTDTIHNPEAATTA